MKKGIFDFLKGSLSKDINEEETVQSDPSAALQTEESTKNVITDADDSEVLLSEEVGEFAVAKLQEILNLCDFKSTVILYKTVKNRLYLKIEIDQDQDDAQVTLGRIIGKDGNSLESFQTLLRAMVYKRFMIPIQIDLDCGGYRYKKEGNIRSKVFKVVRSVVQKGQSVEMEPMSANERRFVHMLLKNHDKVTTFSVGEGSNRRLVIDLKAKKD